MPSSTPPAPRRDLLALAAGVLFSLLFTALIWVAGVRLEDTRAQLLPDAGASWYYWKLPDPTLWSRASAWGLYALHQVALWGLIYYAQSRPHRYTTGLHRVNVVALGVNALFILLHFIQTHIWYDGLAQDVSIFSSQGSVILLLVAVLLMENQRRGLVWGKKAPISQEVGRFVRRYHGYLFAWAAVYTFWYHPMESTSGHLIGFVYMFFLLLQGSLFFTRVHINRWWTLAQEVLVLVHGTLVAVGQGNGIWPMFAFGFAGLFIITQMHGLGLALRTRLGLLALYVGLVVWVYSDRGLAQLNEIIRIPLIEYVVMFLMAGLIWLGLWMARRVRRSRYYER